MSITVKDCLNLPSLRESHLVCGKEGIHKIVSSVSVVEFFNDTEIMVYNPNEILISAFYAVKDNPEKQCEAIIDLANTGAVALVLFYVKNVIKELSEEFIQTANSLQLPIILIDDESQKLKYSDVINDVMSAIIKDQVIAQNLITSIKERLVQMPQAKRTLENLLKILTDTYKCNIILSYNSKIYFSSPYIPYSKIHNPEEIIFAFENTPMGYDSKQLPNGDSVYSAYKMNFYHASNAWITLYASSSGNALNQTILEEICNCTDFFTTLWGYSLDMQSPQGLLSYFLKTSKSVTGKVLSESGLQFSSLSNLLIISNENEDPDKLHKAVKEILTQQNKFFISGLLDNWLVILTTLHWSDYLDALVIEEIQSKCKNDFPNSYIFLDNSNDDISDMQETYTEFCESAKSIKKIFRNRYVWDIHDMLLAQEIATILNRNESKKSRVNSIIKILDGDNDNLMETLSVYLIDCDSQLNETAKHLFLHRNTISYRLNKIKKLTNTDFTKMPSTYDFYVAAALWRLNLQG